MNAPEPLFARFRESGDATALAAVFDALAPELLLVAAHVAPVAADAEDLVQATFLDAIEKRARWDDARPLQPWLIGILVNHAHELRRRRQRSIDASRLASREVPSPLDELAEREVGERIAEAVRALPRQYRQVLTLRLAHGMQPTAIAHALGCPVATVKTRLQRGMDALRQALPASLAATAGLLVASGPGLAQVRALVLERAASVVPTAGAVVSLSLLGGLAVKKIAITVLAAAAVLVAWIGLQSPPGPAADPAPPPSVTPALELRADAAAAANDQNPASSMDRTRVANAGAGAARRTGALVLHMVWADDHSPAAHVHVSWRRDDRRGHWRADESGSVLQDGLSPGEYQVFGASFSRAIAVVAGERVEAEVEVKDGLRLRGVVVDDLGSAVADAAIQVQYFPSGDERDVCTVARSAADGTFRCRIDRLTYVWARRSGFATSAAVCVTPEDNPELRLVLGAAEGVVRGRVRNADGAVGSGVALTIVRTKPSDVCSGPLRLETAADGTFRSDELGPGEHLLVATAAGHAATPVEFTVTVDAPTVLDVQLHRGATLTGTIRRDGVPEPRGRVEVRPDWAGGAGFTEARRPLYLQSGLTARADTEGNYRIEGIPSGMVTVECTVRPEAEARRLELEDGAATRCDFDLPGDGELRGRATDRNGVALAGWRVVASPIGGGHVMETTVDPEGRFGLKAAGVTRYRLALFPSASVGVPWFERDDVTPGREELLQAPFAIDSDGTIVVTLLDAAGRAPSAATAVLFRQGRSEGRGCELRPRDDGRFESTPLPPGSYSGGLVRMPEGGAIRVQAFTVAEHGEVDLGTLRLAASGTLELAFRAADGRMVIPSELRAFDAAGNGGPAFERNADGALCSPPWPAGEYTVRAWGEDFAPVEQRVTIVAGRASPYAVQVASAARVAFHCAWRAHGAAKGVARIDLAIHDVRGKPIGFRQIDVDAGGATCVVGLLPGEYRWEVTLPGAAPAGGAFAVAGDAPVDVAVALSAPND